MLSMNLLLVDKIQLALQLLSECLYNKNFNAYRDNRLCMEDKFNLVS